MISSHIRDRWIAQSDAAERKSTTKSRSETASMLLAARRRNPSSRATIRGSMRQRGRGQRARAERHHVGAFERLRETFAIAIEHLDVGEHVMGQRYRLRALQMRIARHHGFDVALGNREAATRAAARGRPSTSPSSSRRKSLRSSATWSLRERAVWSFAPAAPIFAVSRRSIARWISSSESSKRKRPESISRSIEFSPATIRAASPPGDQPHLREHPRVRDRAADIVAIEPAIERNRSGERLDFLEAAARETAPDQITQVAAWRRAGLAGSGAFSHRAGRDSQGHPRAEQLMTPLGWVMWTFILWRHFGHSSLCVRGTALS